MKMLLRYISYESLRINDRSKRSSSFFSQKVYLYGSFETNDYKNYLQEIN